MKSGSAHRLAILTLIAVFRAAGADPGTPPVSVRPDGGAWAITTRCYTARVEADGCLTSLRVAGREFLRSVPTHIPRGLYAYRGGLYRLPSVSASGVNAVTAAGPDVCVRYTFATNGVSLVISNACAQPVSLVAVLDEDVKVAMSRDGRCVRLPARRDWGEMTWFRDEANVTVRGGGRLWGPWSEKYTVWQRDFGGNACATVTVAIAAAPDAKVARARAFAASPPPPTPSDPTGPMWDLAKLAPPPACVPAEGFHEDGVRAVFFEGPPYQGVPTRVFAWIGMPSELKSGTRAPAMVLVHGGGGTAFASWVRRWTACGYAAIAMDTCGCVPRRADGRRWERDPRGGPPGWGGWNQIDDPREDQWAYHAVADVILAHSLLLSLPEVDPTRTGVTGISWGGYLTSLVVGIDNRFKLAVPVYGCGFTDEHGFAGSVHGLGEAGGARWMCWWDPSAYIANARLPILWVNGSNDFAYTLNAWQKTYRLAAGPRTLCCRLRMPHGHGDAGEAPREIYTFADSILKDGPPLARITGQSRDGREVRVTWTGPVPLEKAELNVTRDDGPWQKRNWVSSPAAAPSNGLVTATLPEGARVYYVNLFDSRGCVVSTEHEELAPGTPVP